MTDYIRRLVSGNKARFRDQNLNVELGLYRNRREDAIRFLEHRHGKNYWVFNFCPIKENSYEADVFEGRVSRYPFPDHHAPPLAIMPLAVREMQAWLSGSPDRVAVLHCKAGKGRSGTMACAYLLSLGDSPSPPQLERNYTPKAWAKKRMESTVNALPAEEEPSFTDALKGVLDLHTAQRMKQSSEKEGKLKPGVSIPSQRRFLYYWALLLAHEAPKHMWSNGPRPKVRLTQLKLRMRETSSVIERTSMAKAPTGGAGSSSDKGSSSQVWASLARYDDGLVDLLEDWEAPNSETTLNENLHQIFEDGKWDKNKMVRSFARLGAVNKSKEKTIDGEKIHVYTLTPLSDKRWEGLKHDLHKSAEHDSPEGVILDAGREVRVKLYVGQVFIGWLWFIPHSTSTLSLTRTDIDFPLGLGSAIIDVDIEMEWVVPPHPSDPSRTEPLEPPVRARTEDLRSVFGRVGLREAVEARQRGDE
ncbi:protein-tyrosine phosphatase-like protein [Pholiota molesta]|nr:protein-tyrosine phosphatase-like protein [Pholiota molesta]